MYRPQLALLKELMPLILVGLVLLRELSIWIGAAQHDRNQVQPLLT